MTVPDEQEDAEPSTSTPRLWLVVGAAWLAVQVMVQRWGRIAHDTRLDLLLEPQRFLGGTWHLWDAAADMGRLQNQAVGYLFPMGPFLLLGDVLGVPAWITERLWIAALLGAAFWGLTRLADELRIGSPPARLVAGLSYALSPFFLTRVGNTSVFVQGGALLPWALLPLVQGARRGSPRRSAMRSGVAVLLMGGVNAAVTWSVLLVPGLWLLTRQRGPRRRSLTAWWAVAVAGATAWWVVPLALQRRYGLDFLPLTERADLTTGFTAPFEVLRGTADWLARVVVGVPQLPSGFALVRSRTLVATTAAAAALGVLGLVHRRIPERRFLVVTLLVGVAIVGSGYGGLFGNPGADGVESLLDGPAGALRSVYKFQPVVALPLALGVAHSVAVLGAWVVHRPGLRPGARRTVVARFVALAVPVAVVLGAAQPLFAGHLLNAKTFERVPSWWVEAADELATTSGRTLLVPGLPQADSTWGYTGEEPLAWLARQPWASRSLVPLGSYGAIRYLDAVEAAIERGGDPGLSPSLRRAGFTTVLVRNDGNGSIHRAPPPRRIDDALLASGMVRVASFGPSLRDPLRPEDAAVLHSLELFAVDEAGGETRAAVIPADEVAAVAGDERAPLDLARWDLGGDGIVLARDLPAGAPTASAPIVTDGNRRRFIDFGTTRHNQGPVLAVDEPGPFGIDAADGMYPDADVEDQTVATRSGLTSVRASTFGSVLAATTQWAPAFAVDGDPDTAWAVASELPARGQWLEVELAREREVPSLDVRLLVPDDEPGAIYSLRVVTDGGSVTTKIDPSSAVQRLGVAGGPTSTIRVLIAGADSDVHSVGIRELEVPGIEADQRLVVPPRRRRPTARCRPTCSVES